MHINSRLLESVLSLSILNVLNMVLPLVTLPYMIKVIGLENYGIYSIVYALIQYMLLLSSYGFNLSVTRQIAQNRDNHDVVNGIVNATLGAKIILMIIAFVIFISVAILLFSWTHVFMLILGLGVVMGDVMNPVWLFQGMEKMKYMTMVNITCKTIFTILIFVCIKHESDYLKIPLLNSAGYLFSGIVSLLIAYRVFRISITIPKLNDVIFQLKAGWYIFLSTVCMELYRNSNVFVLGLFTSNIMVGIYAGAEKVVKAAQSVASPISNALFPHLANNFKDNTISANVYKLKRVSLIMSLFLISILLIVLLFATPINNMLLSAAEPQAIVLIRMMTPVILFGGLNYILGIVGLVNLGFQRYFLKYVFIAGIVSIGFLIVAVNLLGVIAASIAMCLSELILFICCTLKLSTLSK